MAEKRVQRRLAAILAADVVGYSRLMEQDETETLAALKTRWRNLMAPGVARHNGRVVKLMGDGVLVEFASAVDAVQCAVALQKDFAVANEGVAQDRQIILRIGINLGDVIVEGSDLYGDGVNIAARLEALAEPGSIFVSASVYDQVKRKLSAGFDDLGPQVVKNIVELIHVYRVSDEAHKRPPNRPRSEKRLMLRRKLLIVFAIAVAFCLAATALVNWLPARQGNGLPKLAVLPFVNLSGEAENDRLSLAIGADVLLMLSTSPFLQSVQQLSDQALSSPQQLRAIAVKSGAEYILDGSIRSTNGTVKITARLVHGIDDDNIWSMHFEYEAKGLSDVARELTLSIYSQIASFESPIRQFQEAQTWNKPREQLTEADFHWRGHTSWAEAGPSAARDVWQEGIERFSDSAVLRLEIAYTLQQDARYGAAQFPIGAIDTAWNLMREVEQIPGKSRLEVWLYHYYMAMLSQLHEGDFEGTITHAEATHAIAPYDPYSSVDMAYVMTNAGRVETAVEWAEYGTRARPDGPEWFWVYLGWAYYNAGRADDAIRAYSHSRFPPKAEMAAALVRAHRADEAKLLIKEIIRESPSFTLREATSTPGGKFPLMVAELLAPYSEDLKTAGLK